MIDMTRDVIVQVFLGFVQFSFEKEYNEDSRVLKCLFRSVGLISQFCAKLSILFHALSYVQNFDKCLVSECRIFYSPDLKSVQTLTRLSFAFFIKVQQSTILIWCSFDNESGGKYQDNIHRYLGGMAMCFIVSFLSFCSFVSLRSPFL